MTIAQICPIHDDVVYRITAPYEGGGTVFLYLLKAERIALIDTGTTSTPARVLVPALSEIGLAPSDVDLVLNTHGHHDHAGGNLSFKMASGALIHLHPADIPIAQSVDAELDYHITPFRTFDFPADLIQRRTDIVQSTAGVEKAKVDILVSHGDTIDLGRGIVLAVIHTPGHTKGSVCFYWADEGILFTADAVQGLGPRAGAFPYYADAASYRSSLKTLAALDTRLLCLGHAVLGGGVINSPTRAGEDIESLIQDSLIAADTIQKEVARAMEQIPGASKREVALHALSELIYSIPQIRVRGAEMPLLAAGTLLAHIHAAEAGDYPV